MSGQLPDLDLLSLSNSAKLDGQLMGNVSKPDAGGETIECLSGDREEGRQLRGNLGFI
jgi:hypothetical protein